MAGREQEYRPALRRPNNVTTRFSNDELERITVAAKSANVSLSEWFRITILATLDDTTHNLLQTLIHEDLQFIKMFLANVMPPYMAGEAVTKAQIMGLLSEMKDRKVAASTDAVRSAQDRKES